MQYPNQEMLRGMDEMMKAYMEATPMMLQLLKLQALLIQYAWLIVVVFCINAIITARLLYEIVRDFRGADRLSWVILITIPIFGPILYVTLGLKERDSPALIG